MFGKYTHFRRNSIYQDSINNPESNTLRPTRNISKRPPNYTANPEETWKSAVQMRVDCWVWARQHNSTYCFLGKTQALPTLANKEVQ